MATNWWGGGAESAPTEEDYRKAGWFYRTDREAWEPPAGWQLNPSVPGGYSPPASFDPLKQPTLNVGWRATPEQLQALTSQAPVSKPRFVETGEGGYTTYDYYDPASQAKSILAQPEKVTPEYIKQNFAGFERLPAATLQAMANDWRNAYAQLMKISAPEKLPEGYAQAVSRVEKGKPFISFGGPTEIFQEAAPYVTYDPQYGLIVPQQGIQPYKEKFGIMNLVPSLMLGAAFGPLAGALGGGIAGAAGAGALTGGLSSAINQGDVLKGALTGGITAGLGTAAAPAISQAVGATGLTGAAADAVKAGAMAAGKAAITGGDPLQAAIVAATGAGVGSTVGGLEALKGLDPTVAKALTAAASSAARAAVGGGDPVSSALSSAIQVGAQAIPGLTVGKVAPVAPVQTPSTPDILAQLGAQNQEAQTLQRVLADAGVVPEQRGLLAGDYKQEGIGDVLARAAESVLGALVPSAQASGQDRLVLTQPEAGRAPRGIQPEDYKSFLDLSNSGDFKGGYEKLSNQEKDRMDVVINQWNASSAQEKKNILSAYVTGQLSPIQTPSESWIDRGMLGTAPASSMQDIMDVLTQQESEQKKMQEALSGYVKPEDVQQGISSALTKQQATTDAAIAALERSTGQKIAAGDADILKRLTEQGASQSQMEAALRGEIGGLGAQFNTRMAESDKKLADFAKQTGQNLTTLKSQFDAAFKDAQAKGASSDAALQAAIDKVGATSAANQKATDTQLKGLGVSVSGLESGQKELAGKLSATDSKLDAFAKQTGQSFTTIKNQFDAAFKDAQAKGASSDAALQAAIDKVGATAAANQKATDTQLKGLGVSVAGLESGQKELAGKLSATDSKLDAFAKQTGQSFTTIKNQFDAAFKDAQAKGASSDAALQAAINKVATDSAASQKATTEQISKLGANIGTVQAAVGQLGATTQAQFGDINSRINQLQQQGLTQSQATSKALQELTGGQAQLEQRIVKSAEQQKAEQQAMEAALRGEIGGLGKQVTAGQQATQAQFGDVNTRINQLQQQGMSQAQATSQALRELAGGQSQLEQQLSRTTQQQQAEQRAMEAALRGEIGGLGTQFQQNLISAMQRQGASQAEMEAALRGEISGVGSTFQRSLQEAMAKQQTSQAEMERALRGEIGGLGGTLQQQIVKSAEQQKAEQKAMEAALRGEIGGLGTQFQQNLIAAMQRQGASQAEMEAALRGEISGVGSTFQRSLQEAMAQQQSSQAAMEQALRGEIGGLGAGFDKRVSDLMAQGRDYQTATNQALIELSRGQEELGGQVSGLGTTFEQRLRDVMAQQGASQAEMEAALRGEIGGLGGTLQQQIAAESARQQAEQKAMEAALRGEIGGLGTTFDKRLAEILAQQEEEQASMQGALRGYDQRILDLMAQGESEQEAMRRALEESQATTQQQIAGVQTGLGQQIGGLGKTLSEALTGVTQQFGTTTQNLQQQLQQTQQQAQMGNLLAMMGLMQQGKKEAPPIPLVGEIKPFEFSTDLLEGLYQPSRTGLLGANDQLLKMTRG